MITKIYQFLCVCLILNSLYFSVQSRTFAIDYAGNQFLKDGQPFRYISGSMHYFRVPAIHWKDRFLKMRAAGLNAIQTYIEWSSHEPEMGSYDFSGYNDFVRFVQLAQQTDLLVLIRLGPFIASERDNMGLPYWLASKYPNITYRTSDPNFLKYVDNWYAVLLPMIRPLLYANGGPVIMVQVENEYGSYFACDFGYTAHLRNLVRSHLGGSALLYTVDGGDSGYLKCGRVEDVYATVDFGYDSDPVYAFGQQRLFEESGPLVNTEYYPGWFDVWGEPHHSVSDPKIYSTLDKMLSMNASVNIYMFHGGTSFGFTAGATTSPYRPMPTSYDYDAPISECGDLTDKYFAIKQVIAKHAIIPDIPVTRESSKMKLNAITLSYMDSIFDMLSEPIRSSQPLSFEELQLRHGFVLYVTNISFTTADPSVLSVANGVFDRAMIFANRSFVGVLSRIEGVKQMPIMVERGTELAILVENEGHACCSKVAERKGIIGSVTLGTKTLYNWHMYRLFPSWSQAVARVEKLHSLRESSSPLTGFERVKSRVMPAFYTASYVLPNDSSLPLDTFFEAESGWKGLAFVNGVNIGRYWPRMGPQVTLYAPKDLFNAYPINNFVTILELERPVNETVIVRFTDKHVINGTTPDNVFITRDLTEHH